MRRIGRRDAAKASMENMMQRLQAGLDRHAESAEDSQTEIEDLQVKMEDLQAEIEDLQAKKERHMEWAASAEHLIIAWDTLRDT